jgi:hypothetical protein
VQDDLRAQPLQRTRQRVSFAALARREPAQRDALATAGPTAAGCASTALWSEVVDPAMSAQATPRTHDESSSEATHPYKLPTLTKARHR